MEIDLTPKHVDVRAKRNTPWLIPFTISFADPALDLTSADITGVTARILQSNLEFDITVERPDADTLVVILFIDHEDSKPSERLAERTYEWEVQLTSDNKYFDGWIPFRGSWALEKHIE